MPIRRRWDPRTKIWTLSADVSFDLADIARLVGEPDWHGGNLFLWDLREIQKGPDSTPELREAVQLIEQSQEKWGGGRAAIVVSRDVDFGIARMFSVFAEQIDVHYQVFRDLDEALRWLEAASDLVAARGRSAQPRSAKASE